MKPKKNCKNTVAPSKPMNNRQLHMVVGGCNVKLNFPTKSEDSAINDVKRMMLGDVAKP